jgi:hypothetical protein
MNAKKVIHDGFLATKHENVVSMFLHFHSINENVGTFMCQGHAIKEFKLIVMRTQS